MVIVNMQNEQVVERAGEIILEPGESIAIGMYNSPGAIQVTVNTSASYMVGVTQARKSKVLHDTAVFLPVADIDKTANEDFYIAFGGFVKIENRAESEGSIIIDWRV